MKAIALTASLLLVGCAASNGGLNAAARGTSVVPSQSAEQIEIAAELDIAQYAADTQTICRRQAPLGSRISVDRCEEVDRARDDEEMSFLVKQELEQMRQQQMFQQQQQREAMRGQMRDSAMMPGQ